MADDKKVSWIAIIGLVVTVLTFYYSRHDKAKEEKEARPLLTIQNVGLRRRTITRYPVTPGDNRSGLLFEFDSGVFAVTNQGSHVAGNAAIFVTKGMAEEGGAMLPDISPNETQNINVSVAFGLPEFRSQVTRFIGVIRYKDRTMGSGQFEEPFCFEIPIDIGMNENSQVINQLPLIDFSPPATMYRCNPLDTWPK